MIEHTLLMPNASRKDLIRLCEEAQQWGFCGVCVYPGWIKTCRKHLNGSAAKVVTVVGFPHGLALTATKVSETQQCIEAGADEIDMVMPIGAFLDGLFEEVSEDIHRVVEAAAGCPVKVIVETVYLNDLQKGKAASLAAEAGAAFVKTSTGFAAGGATAHDVRLLRAAVGSQVGVKASGGVRTTSDALAMVEAGANRIGTSCGVALVNPAP